MKKILWLSLCAALLASCKTAQTPSSIQPVTYHGWAGSYILGNGLVEAVVVPAVGRVMQFRFSGEQDGPIWENRALDGKLPDPLSRDWANFGGDKSWPAPQADWPKITSRGWPPPQTFDSMPVMATPKQGSLVLESAVDPHFGIRTIRTIRLLPNSPRMVIVTEYIKVKGEPSKVAVWTISQLKDPLKVTMPVRLWNGVSYNKQGDQLPANWNAGPAEITMTRGKSGSSKVGGYGDFLIWTDGKAQLQIDSPRLSEGEYPDNGSSIEVYTNSDPLPYVELELLNPLHTLSVGDHISKTNTYTLSRVHQ